MSRTRAGWRFEMDDVGWVTEIFFLKFIGTCSSRGHTHTYWFYLISIGLIRFLQFIINWLTLAHSSAALIRGDYPREFHKSKMKVVVRTVQQESALEAVPKTSTRDIFSLICKSLGIQETWYFGLMYYGADKEEVWVDQSKKVRIVRMLVEISSICGVRTLLCRILGAFLSGWVIYLVRVSEFRDGSPRDAPDWTGGERIRRSGGWK